MWSKAQISSRLNKLTSQDRSCAESLPHTIAPATNQPSAVMRNCDFRDVAMFVEPPNHNVATPSGETWSQSVILYFSVCGLHYQVDHEVYLPPDFPESDWENLGIAPTFCLVLCYNSDVAYSSFLHHTESSMWLQGYLTSLCQLERLFNSEHTRRRRRNGRGLGRKDCGIRQVGQENYKNCISILGESGQSSDLEICDCKTYFLAI